MRVIGGDLVAQWLSAVGLSAQVQIPAHTGKKTGGSINVTAVLLIELKCLISPMSIVKSSITSQRVKFRDLVAQWFSAVDQ